MAANDRYHCVVLGINHRTCPVGMRDRLGFSQEGLAEQLRALLALPALAEVVILSTCNRTELYAATPYPEAVRDTMLLWWAESRGADASEMEAHCYYLAHESAVGHLFRVVASVDSLVVGEAQILGQVRESYRLAQQIGSTGFHMNHLFQTALAVGKDIRRRTSIGDGAVSMAFAAVELCRQRLGSLQGLGAVVLGAGEMGTLAARNLKDAGVGPLVFVNRTWETAQKLADLYGGEALPLDCISTAMARCAILISCTSAAGFVLFPEDLHDLSPLADGRRRLLVDIAAPRDIHPEVGSLPAVELCDIDDMRRVVETNREKRRQAAQEARLIIEDAVRSYKDWYLALDMVPILSELRIFMQKRVEQELSRWESRVDANQLKLLERMAQGLAGRLLHTPSVRLRELGSQGRVREASQWLRLIFGLGEDATSGEFDE